MATPFEIDEVAKRKKELWALKAEGKIEIEEYYRLMNELNAINAEASRQRTELQAEQGLLDDRPKYVPEIMPYMPESNVARAQADAYRAIKGKYLDRGMPEEEAADQAVKEINKVITPATMNYADVGEEGMFGAVSNIADIEKGLIFDENQEEIREGTPYELFVETLKRQPLSTSEQFERRQEQLEREARQRSEQMYGTEQGFSDFARQFYGTMLDPKAIEPLLMEPADRSGLIVETQLGRGLRVGTNLISAAAAVPLAGITPGLAEDEMYRMADSDPDAGLIERSWDQFLVNVADGQGTFNVVYANPRQGPAPIAMLTGLATELLIPATPLFIAKGALKGTGMVGRGLTKAGTLAGDAPVLSETMKGTGITMQAVANPIEAARYGATYKAWDDALKNAGSSKSAKDISEQYYAKAWDKDNWFDNEIKRNSLNELAAEEVARSVRDATIAGDVQKMEAAAVANPQFARVYNRSKAIDEAVKAAREYDPTTIPIGEKSFEALPMQRVKTGKLALPVRNEVARVVLARMEASGQLTKAQKGRIFHAANLQKGAEQADEMVRTILDKRLGIDLSTARIDEVEEAWKNVLKKDVKEHMQDFLPQRDVSMVTSNVLVRSSIMRDKNAVKNFENELRKYNEAIKAMPDGKYKVKKTIADEIIADIIDDVGVETIRQSERYRELLNMLSKDGEFTLDFRGVVDESLRSQAAIRHLGGMKIESGGAQFQQARIPIELRGDIIAMSEAGTDPNIAQQLSAGEIGKLTRDLVRSFNTVTSRINKTPLINKQSPSPPTEFAALPEQLQATMEMMEKNLQKELARRTKAFGGNGVWAVDSIMDDVWQKTVIKTEQRLDRAVDTGVFENSWINMMSSFEEPRYRQQIAGLLGIKDADELLGMVGNSRTEEAVRKLVIDYNLYFPKKDEWRRLISTYYGSEMTEELFESNIRHLLHVDFGVDGFRDMRPRASTMLDINYTNFREVIARTEKFNTNLAGKGLKTNLLGKEANMIPPLEWILTSNRAEATRKVMDEFVDRNPQYTIELRPDHYSIGMEIDLAPLATRYENLFADTINRLRQSSVELQAGWEQRFKGIGQELAELHFQTVSRISSTKRKEIVDQIIKLVDESGTTQPSLKTMERQLQKELEVPKGILDRGATQILDSVIARGEQWQATRAVEFQDLKDKIWEIFFFDNPINGVYYSTPTMSVAQDILREYKSFYNRNGLAVGDDLTGSLNQNLPMFNRIGNSDFLIKYSPEEISTVKKLQALAGHNNLKATIDSLRGRAEGTWMTGAIMEVVDFFRSTAIQGMLGGGPLGPNPAYHTMNILAAPLIMLNTIGLTRMAGAISSDMWKSLIVKNASDTDIVLTVEGTGRQFTAQEYRAILSQNNLGMTQADLAFYKQGSEKILRSAGLDIAGNQYSGLRQLSRYLNPGDRTAWSIFADETDMTFRQAVFYGAMRSGVPVDQAVQLAKRSILDYGAMSSAEKRYMLLHLTFWSFQRQMLAETVNALYKSVVGGGGHKYLATAIRTTMRQQQSQESWLLGNDRQKARVYSIYKGMLEHTGMWTYGVSNPTVESMETFSFLFSMGCQIMYDPMGLDKALSKTLKDGQWSPIKQFMIESIEGNNSQIPPQYVVLAKSLGVWDEFVEAFDVVPRPTSERRAQDPVFGATKSQYMFHPDKNGAGRFSAMQLLLLGSGMQRQLRHVGGTMMAADVPPGDEEFDYKRYSTPTWWTFLPGLETSLKQKDTLTVEAQNKLQNQKKLESSIQY